MHRIRLVTVFATALLLAASGTAAAKSSNHHKKHHAPTRHAHRVRTHTVNIAPSSPTTASSAAPSDSAGTIASFTSGVLTITLNDGSTVSGMVIGTTQIACGAASSAGATTSGEDNGDNNGAGNQVSSDLRAFSTDQGGGGGESSGADDNGGGDDNGTGATSCDMSSLVAGAVVHDAELRVSSSGSTFVQVELV